MASAWSRVDLKPWRFDPNPAVATDPKDGDLQAIEGSPDLVDLDAVVRIVGERDTAPPPAFGDDPYALSTAFAT